MSSAIQDLRSTFTGITKDITSVFSLMIIFAVLMIVLPILLQINNLIQRLTGVQPIQPMAGLQPTSLPAGMQKIELKVMPK